MKLIFTSKAFNNSKITDSILKHFNRDISLLKVLLVATPCLPYGPEKYLNEMVDRGFKKENIIIFDYKNASNYSNLDIDAIYVTGGNTFTGLKMIKESGFDKVIINYVNNGVIYIGRSAGTHIATKNIEHVLEFDSNDVGLTDFEGLGLLDGIVVCHYDSNRETCYNNLVSENKYNVYTLTNEEILVIDNEIIQKY